MIGIVVAVLAAAPTPAAAAQAEIMAAMTDSAAGWNAGDLDRFMRVYSAAADTSFVVKDGIVSSKAAIAARYRPRFAAEVAAKRGTLSFEVIRFTLLDARHALLIARYRLRFADAPEQRGPTSLVFVREAGGWRIVADHSS
jgi:uncharacterized protein (TIGR02246 family)